MLSCDDFDTFLREINGNISCAKKKSLCFIVKEGKNMIYIFYDAVKVQRRILTTYVANLHD